MKVLVIPDIHQSLTAIDYIYENYIHSSQGDANRIVFLGDLVDDWESKELWMNHQRNPVTMVNTLIDIKKSLGDKFIWLLGNHDLSYLPGRDSDSHNVSGHQWEHAAEISTALLSALPYIQVAVRLDKVVYSHAGFSKDWCSFAKGFISKHQDVLPKDLLQAVNRSIHPEVQPLMLYSDLLDHRGISPSGDDTSEGPLWIRPLSMVINQHFSKQVVGHTEMKKPWLYKCPKTEILIADTKDHSSFLTIIDGNLDSANVEVTKVSEEQIKYEKGKRQKMRSLSFASMFGFF